jgi:hypothetical protein
MQAAWGATCKTHQICFRVRRSRHGPLCGAADIQPIFYLCPDVSYHLWSYESYCARNPTSLSLKIHARNLRWKAEADLSCYLVTLMEAIINIYLFVLARNSKFSFVQSRTEWEIITVHCSVDTCNALLLGNYPEFAGDSRLAVGQ